MKTALIMASIVGTMFGVSSSKFVTESATAPGSFSFSGQPTSSKGDDGKVKPITPSEPIERYEIYDGDESSNFNDAVSLTVGTEYEFYFNDRGDTDYFITYFSSAQCISLTIDKNSKLNIYRYSHEQYYRGSLPSSNKMVIDEAGYYFISVKSVGTYTGPYSIDLANETPTTSLGNYYVEMVFGQAAEYGPRLLYRDYSMMASSGTKEQRITSVQGTPSSFNWSTGTLLETTGSVATNGYQYVSSSSAAKGVYNISNIATNYVADDDRIKAAYSDFPGDSICFTKSYFDQLGSYYIGTSFFVDDEYLFTAAHVMLTENYQFSRAIAVEIERNLNNPLSTLDAEKGFIPYDAFLSSVNGSIDRTRDWCLLKVSLTTLYSWYQHGFLGLKYDSTVSFTGHVFGYPAYYLNDPTVNGEKYVCAASTGTMIKSNGLWITYADMTEGQSGGPLIEFDFVNQKAYVRGIVSGGTTNSSGNMLCPIDKTSFYFLDEML